MGKREVYYCDRCEIEVNRLSQLYPVEYYKPTSLGKNLYTAELCNTCAQKLVIFIQFAKQEDCED